MSNQEPPSPVTAAQIYGPIISEQIEREEARKSSLEQRGLAVISTSGVLVSLLFALGAIGLPRSEAPGLPVLATVLLVAALLAFVAAAGLGLATNLPRAYQALALRDLRRMASLELWEKASGPAARRIAESQVEMIAAARKHNAAKAKLLRWAIAAETVGVGLIASSVADLFVQRR
jgi:hypothetical protein